MHHTSHASNATESELGLMLVTHISRVGPGEPRKWVVGCLVDSVSVTATLPSINTIILKHRIISPISFRITLRSLLAF